MPRTVTLKLTLTEEEIAAMKRYAAATYKPGLGVTWRNVAAGWARGAIEERVEELGAATKGKA